MFISIIDFASKDIDNSAYIAITVVDSMDKAEETKRFDEKNYDVVKWIQVESLKILKDNIINIELLYQTTCMGTRFSKLRLS